MFAMELACERGHRWVAGAADRSCPACGRSAIAAQRGTPDVAVTLSRGVARVLVADQQERRREAVAGRLQRRPEYDVVAHAFDGADAAVLAQLLQPDVAIVAERMPRVDGLAAIPLLLEAAPRLVVVLQVAVFDSRTVEHAFRVGAAACARADRVDVWVESVLPGLLSTSVDWSSRHRAGRSG